MVFLGVGISLLSAKTSDILSRLESSMLISGKQ